MSRAADRSAVRKALRAELGLDVSDIWLTAGGDINDAYRAETSRGPVFVKTSPTAQSGMFSDEAAGLQWLSVPDGVAVPHVVGVSEGATKLLALEWIEAGRMTAAGEEELGRGLARVHLAGAPFFGATPGVTIGDEDTGDSDDGYGHSPMRFNELSLPNDPCETWAEFYAENRLMPLALMAQEKGNFEREDVALIERVCARLPELAGPAEPPARTHGDLWSGNVLWDAGGKPYLIDPVAHGGHREVDLALLTVFGGPSERCFAAYDEVFPRAEGHAERKSLWQLAMILLHVHLFGGGYVEQARALARIHQ
jgi:fructosamine-3-kinase